MASFAIYALAALAEIAGCFAFWAWLRMGRSVWLLAPGMVSLALFAWLLTLVPSEAAGRAYAAYGGVLSSRRSCGCGLSKAGRRIAGICRERPYAWQAPRSSCSGRAADTTHEVTICADDLR